MAQNKQVSILLLPTLKTITLQTIGFATAAFALKVTNFLFGLFYKKYIYFSFLDFFLF